MQLRMIHNTEMRTLSENLRMLMKRDGIGQADLSRMTKIPAPTISRLTTGETTNPTLDTVRTLAKHFGVGISELCGERPIPGLDPLYRGEFSVPYPKANEVLQLIRRISSLDEDGKLRPEFAKAILNLLLTV